MAKRRGKGEGSVYQRADGRWVGQVENGFYANGRRKYLRIVRKTQGEVIEAMRTVRKGGKVLDGNMRVSALMDAWLGHLADEGGKDGQELSPSTIKAYRSMVDGWIKPHRIGGRRLRDLEARDIEVWLGQLKSQGLAQSSRAKAKVMLSGALGWAVRHRKMLTNPAREVTVRQSRRGKLDDNMNREQVHQVLAIVADDPFEVAAVLGLKLGLRIGEVVGLRWSDIDFETAELHVRRTITKTDEGARTLPLLPEVAEALKRRRSHQDAERLTAGPLWIQTGYVLTNVRGQAVSTNGLRRWWHQLCERAGVGRHRFHSGRHTCATLLLDDGIPLEVVSAICGHANLAITADIYAKVTKDSMRRSLTKFATDIAIA